MTATRPDLRFLLSHPAHFIALGFGSGLAPLVPGTFGTLVAIPLALLLHAYGNDVAFLAAVAATVAIGAWSAQVAGRDLGVADHGSIVIDEVAAFLLVLFFVGVEPLRIAVAFVLFRIFDIVKPPPIGHVDATFKNGAGVMADDLLAALYALVVFAIGQRVFGY
ncbi:MAG: phosphatidylglycerophosphatase A [Casimicrobiaceae bacterium]